VTDLSQPDGLEPGGTLPQRDDSLPQRPAPLPQRGAPLPQRGAPLPQRDAPSPQGGAPLTRPGGPLPQRRPALDSPPSGSEELPRRGDALPQREPLPRRGEPLPQRGQPLPQRSEPLPQRNDPLPQRSEPLPQRAGGSAAGAEALPRRTGRTRPAGRHRSPHRLSVASDAPALVLAVPGSAEADSAGIGPAVASTASLSCPGVDIRLGYLEGDTQPVSDCILGTSSSGGDHFPSVIVPLLLSPNPRIDAELRSLAARPALPAVLAPHLGPHPLVAEGLHARLAEAGLARHARSTGLSISADGRGVIVLADVSEEAANAAAVAAVLLASRLSVPVVPASLGDPASIVDAATRLTESGALSPALSPCLIGPETSIRVLDDLSTAIGTPCAPVLGAHQSIGQLVAIRYGVALASLSLAG
jgi:hypothetical protein